MLPYAAGIAAFCAQQSGPGAYVSIRQHTSEVLDACAREYRSRATGRCVEALGNSRVFSHIYMKDPVTNSKDEPGTKHRATAMLPPCFFEVHEWDLTDALHRSFLRNAIVAQIRLAGLVGKHVVLPPAQFPLADTSDSRSQQTEFERPWPWKPLLNAYLLADARHAVTIIQAQRMDVSLSELLASTGAIPEVILGAILVQIVAILERLHDIGGCVHNDIDARNFFISTDLVTPDVRLGGFFYSHFPLRTPGASIDAKNCHLARHARKALLKLYQGALLRLY